MPAIEKDGPELALDKSAETGFCTFFASLPPKRNDLVRFFTRSDYYSLHGDDAILTADEFYKTSSVLKYLGPSHRSLPSCTLSRLNAATWMRDLLLNQSRRIEIWENDRSGWKVAARASPGNLEPVSDIIFFGGMNGKSDDDIGTGIETGGAPITAAPVIMAIIASGERVSVAFTDATTMKVFGVAEFEDNESFSNLEALLVQLDVKECLIPEDANNYDLKQLKSVLSRCDVVVTEMNRGEFKSNHIEQDMNRLLKEEEPLRSSPVYEMKSALSCISCLIRYLQLIEDEANYGEYSLSVYDLSHFMRLDAAAVCALNIVPTQQGNNKMSVYGILNQCKTAQGSRLLRQWVKQPLINRVEIETRLDQVELLFKETGLRESVRNEHLKTFPDLHRLARRFQKGKGSLQDVIRVYQVVISLSGLVETLEEYSSFEHGHHLQEIYISKLKGFIDSLSKFKELVETTIDLDALDRHQYVIKPDFHEQLMETRLKLDEIYQQLEPIAHEVARDLHVEFGKKLKFEKSPIYGHHLRLSRLEANKIRGKSAYIELATQRAGVLFTTSNLRRLNNEFTDLSTAYEALQKDLAKEVISITATYFPVFELVNQLVAQLDVLSSFAEASSRAPTQYVRPQLLDLGTDGQISIKGGRHPCVELQEDIPFIPNDTLLSPDESFHILTGPNMGGKSTYIRQIGVITIMAQMGCFVPCEEATIRIVDSILARVGAGDSQLKGISTFMAEMLEVSSILKSATKDSLVIIDELGRGTSTYDGFGLAWAIAEHIASQIKGFTLFATHFHELTALSDLIPTVRNYHVSALFNDGKGDENQKSLTLLYRVTSGVCDQSFGIHVAELARFPETVIRLAKRKAAELEDFETGDKMDVDGRETDFSDLDATTIAEGEEMIASFLAEYQALEIQGMTDTVLETALDSLKNKYKLSIERHPYTSRLVSDL